jgi:hypothetical protein
MFRVFFCNFTIIDIKLMTPLRNTIYPRGTISTNFISCMPPDESKYFNKIKLDKYVLDFRKSKMIQDSSNIFLCYVQLMTDLSVFKSIFLLRY